MGLFKKRASFSVLVSVGLLVSGCGGDTVGENAAGKNPEDNVVMQIIEGPPQVTITLHSKLELDFSLDPDPQLQVSEADTNEIGEVDNKFIAEVYAKQKRSGILRSQSGKQPEYKLDAKYQSIQRYENMEPGRYAITIEKSPQKPPTRKTVKVQDKPLIFAGRGYNISVFEKETKPAIDVDYATHLVTSYPDPPAGDTKERLDLKAGYSKDTKFLVYNSTRSAFGELPPPLIESKPELPQKTEPVSPPERNPDSVLLFPRGEKSLLVLRRAEKQFDLLAGNESLNKKQFKASKIP
jgi:hypothetical protein